MEMLDKNLSNKINLASSNPSQVNSFSCDTCDGTNHDTSYYEIQIPSMWRQLTKEEMVFKANNGLKAKQSTRGVGSTLKKATIKASTNLNKDGTNPNKVTTKLKSKSIIKTIIKVVPPPKGLVSRKPTSKR